MLPSWQRTYPECLQFQHQLHAEWRLFQCKLVLLATNIPCFKMSQSDPLLLGPSRDTNGKILSMWIIGVQLRLARASWISQSCCILQHNSQMHSIPLNGRKDWHVSALDASPHHIQRDTGLKWLFLKTLLALALGPLNFCNGAPLGKQSKAALWTLASQISSLFPPNPFLEAFPKIYINIK